MLWRAKIGEQNTKFHPPEPCIDFLGRLNKNREKYLFTCRVRHLLSSFSSSLGIWDPCYEVSEARASSNERHNLLQWSYFSSQDALFSQGTGQMKAFLSQVSRVINEHYFCGGLSSHLIIQYMCDLFISSLSASDCSDFLRGGLAAVWPGSRCIPPSRHCRVHSHGDPPAEAWLTDPLALSPCEQSTTCRRQRKGQEEDLAPPGYTVETCAQRLPFKPETGRNTSEPAFCLCERLEECMCRMQQKLIVHLHGCKHTADEACV